jgi:hypothetical protein
MRSPRARVERDTPRRRFRVSGVGLTLRDVEQPNLLTRLRDYLTSPSSAAGGVGNSIPWESPWADGSHLSIVGELYGLADSSCITISRRTAKSLPVVAKADWLLTSNLSRMRLLNKKGTQLAPQQMPYLQQPEKDRPLAATLNDLARALFYNPRTWLIVKERDAYGWPARGGCKFLPRKDAEFDSDGNLVKAWGTDIAAAGWYAIQFDSPTGGLLYDGAKTLRRAIILDRAASLAEENPVPSIDLHNDGPKPLDEKQIADLLESWRSARAKYGAGYTDKSIKAQTLGIQDSQLLIDAQRQMDLNLARQTGFPAWAVDVALEGSTLNYQNRQSRAWELIDLGLAGYMTPITSRLSMNDATPMGWTTEFDIDALIRPDQKTRFETYKVGMDGGFIDQTYIDAQEGQPLKGVSA